MVAIYMKWLSRWTCFYCFRKGFGNVHRLKTMYAWQYVTSRFFSPSNLCKTMPILMCVEFLFKLREKKDILGTPSCTEKHFWIQMLSLKERKSYVDNGLISSSKSVWICLNSFCWCFNRSKALYSIPWFVLHNCYYLSFLYYIFFFG